MRRASVSIVTSTWIGKIFGLLGVLHLQATNQKVKNFRVPLTTLAVTPTLFGVVIKQN